MIKIHCWKNIQLKIDYILAFHNLLRFGGLLCETVNLFYIFGYVSMHVYSVYECMLQVG